MYPQEIEELIDLIIADGEITEKERTLLHRKATAAGIDLDEIDIVVEGRMAQLKNRLALQTAQTSSPPPPPQPQQPQTQNTKYGIVNRCPHCGATVEGASVSCSQCGYEFRGIAANSSVERLSKMIMEAEKKYDTNVILELFGASKRTSVICSIISNFPVPNTKEDLMEFILFLKPKIKAGHNSDISDEKIAGAYKRKYQECCDKARHFFPNDPQFAALLMPQKKSFFRGLFE